MPSFTGPAGIGAFAARVEPVIAQRSCGFRVAVRGVEEVPAAFARRVILGAKRRDRAPISRLRLDIEAGLAQLLNQHHGRRIVLRSVSRLQDDNTLAFVDAQ